MADLVLHLRGQRQLPLQRRRAQDPLALGQDAHQLRVGVHLDELDQLAPGTRRASSRRSRPGRPAWTYSRNSCVAPRRSSTERSLGFIVGMSTKRTELTREAARLFAEKGYHGTSVGDLADAMGVQKGSLYAHIDSKEDLLYEAMREGADAFHAALDAVPEELPAIERIRLALRGAPARRLRAARRRDRLRPGVALPRGRAARRDPSPSGAATRSASASSSGTDASTASCAPTSTTRAPRCSPSRRRTGPTRGCGPARTRTRSPTGSSRPPRRHARLLDA